MKRTTVHHGKRLLLAGLLGVFLMSPASSFAQPATIAVRGKIASLTGQELIVSSANGDVKTILTDKTVIRAEAPIQLSDISSGMYLGTTATKQADGTFLASEVHGDHGERVGRSRGANRRAFERIEGNVDFRPARADFFADIEHRRLVTLAFADHHGAVDREGIESLAHSVDRRLIGSLLIAAAGPMRAVERRGLGYSDSFQS